MIKPLSNERLEELRSYRSDIRDNSPFLLNVPEGEALADAVDEIDRLIEAFRELLACHETDSFVKLDADFAARMRAVLNPEPAA